MKLILFRISQGIVFLVLILCGFNCSKTEIGNSSNTNVNSDVTKNLIDWVITLKSKSSDIAKQSIDSLLNMASWDKGVINKASSNKSVIYIPLKNATTGLAFFYDSKLNSVDSGNIIQVTDVNDFSPSNLIKGVLTYYCLEILKHKSTTNFSGNYSSYSIFNKYQHEYRFRVGNVVWRKFVAPRIDTKKIETNSVSFKKDAYECEWWGNFTRWSDGSVTLNYVYQVCYECQTTSIGIASGGQYIKNQCGGGGGGGEGSGSASSNLVKDIFVNLTDTCFNNVYNKMITAGWNTTLTGLLRNTFGLNTKMNLRIYDVDAIPSSNPYIIVHGDSPVPPSVDEHGVLNIEVRLSKSTMTNSSLEFMTTILLHEILHAYLHSHGVDYATQHSQMQSGYLDIMAVSLRTIFPNSQVNMTELAKAGLDISNQTVVANRDGTQGNKCRNSN